MSWAKLIKQYTQLETLDSSTLLLLIDKIIVGESELVGKDRVRDVKIIYNYVGDVDRLGLEVVNGKAVLSDDRQAV